MECSVCGKKISKKPSQITYRKGTNWYCSPECQQKAKTKGEWVPCEICGKEVYRSQSHLARYEKVFCSPECAAKGRDTRVDVVCEQCGKVFQRAAKLADSKEHNFCSPKCGYEYQRAHSNTEHVICEQCGKEFARVPSRNSGKHILCSIECRNAYFKEHGSRPRQGEVIACEYCGKEVYKEQAELKHGTHHFCSHECVDAYYANNKFTVDRCHHCGKEIRVPWNFSGLHPHHFCSPQCHSAWYAETRPSPEDLRPRGNAALNNISSLQSRANRLLDELGVVYENEAVFLSWAIDTFLPEHCLAIELHGDYWHVNPTVDRDLDASVIRERDQRRHDRLKEEFGLELLYLWEGDLKHDIDKCKALVAMYIGQQGQLEDYNSFNYRLDENGQLVLQDDPIRLW